MIQIIKYYISLVNKYRILFLSLNSIVFIITISYLLLTTPWFRSTSQILISPDKKNDFLAGLANSLPINLGLTGDVEVDRYIGYLRARSIQKTIIDEFDLKIVYKKTTLEDTFLELNNNLSILDNEDGTINIYFDYEGDVAKAAAINKRFIELLNDFVLRIENTSTRHKREFLEESFNKIKQQTEGLEDSLAHFQRSTKIFLPEEQIAKTIENYSNVDYERIKLIIQREGLKTRVSNQNQLNEINTQIGNLQNLLTEMESGTKVLQNSLTDLTEQSKYYIRLYRTIQVNVKVLEFLRVQLEQARIDEFKSYSGIQIIDEPSTPDKKLKPKRFSTLLSVSFFTLIFSIVLIKSIDIIRNEF